ncbi:hypothetical protein [Cellulomonas denverensis]|uniref:hypothetical protein n=1 Tax=Cellulomonas denverensis TaxID=264297 RepID=UPI001A50F9E2|nr:hypothetical protein [Cellulomonas denverensis]GIG25781.1 hypothetical protein Cde04nite_20250 [Cellulomonas denverensis]
MSLFTRRPTLPDTLRRSLDLPATDRVLAAAELADDAGWLVATRRALHVLPATGDRLTRNWSEVDRGSFDPEGPAITVYWVTGDEQRYALAAPTPVRFAQTFRERVQSSVVHVQNVQVPGAGTVRVALRRDPDGALLTQVIGSSQVDLADPGTAALVDATEREVRAAAGLRD